MTKSGRRPTSADVAEQAGVSRTTVSLVLNERGHSIPEPTRRRVIDAARALGYFPGNTDGSRTRERSQVIALVLRQTDQQVAADALLAETLRGISAAARTAHYRVLVEPVTASHPSYGNIVRSGRADGVIVSGPTFDDPEVRSLVADGFPVVIQGRVPDLYAPSVDVDNVASARLAVDHLLELGHRRIACITNAPVRYTAAADRLAGYREACTSAGVAVDEGLFAEGDFNAPSGHAAMSSVLKYGQPDAVFVASDTVALGAIGAIRDAGLRVPEDISVIGFDDIALAAYFNPSLTTVRVPAHDLGHTAGTAMLDVLSGRDAPLRTLLATRIVARSSTAPRSTGGPI